MTLYTPITKKEISQKKLEEYQKYSELIQWGRKSPVKFASEIFGVQLMDYQAWCFMQSWSKPYVLWLECRSAGKSTLMAIFLMTKMLLIPNYDVYISTNSAQQSIETFTKIEKIALNQIPSFKTLTDIFSCELEKQASGDSGFYHSPAGHKFTLMNGSQLVTLSTNLTAVRGRRGSVAFDESSWMSAEQFATLENFANVDSSFGLGTNKVKRYDPLQMPLQLLYASSAGDVSLPFYDKYKKFAKKMFMGDPNYFVCDFNADLVMNHSSVNGDKIESYLTQKTIDKAVDEDPELADRELFNKFRKGAGQNAVVKAETLVRNSTVRIPLLYNDTGKKKFIFCYDPARNFDGSILSIFQLIDDKEIGYKLQLENVISMVDKETKAKTPLPMPQQLEIIKQALVDYNGDRAAEWENILGFYIDAGSGGGGISAVADQLMEDWIGSDAKTHRGIIDPEHKQYETARNKYPHAIPIVRLIDPQGYKKIMYASLEKNLKLDLINFTEYDGKEYIMLEDENKKGKFINHELTSKERMTLLQINLMKNEIVYISRYDTPNGGVQYELTKDKRNKMHDDMSYTLAEGSYALSLLRRSDMLAMKNNELDMRDAPMCVSAIPF